MKMMTDEEKLHWLNKTRRSFFLLVSFSFFLDTITTNQPTNQLPVTNTNGVRRITLRNIKEVGSSVVVESRGIEIILQRFRVMTTYSYFLSQRHRSIKSQSLLLLLLLLVWLEEVSRVVGR